MKVLIKLARIAGAAWIALAAGCADPLPATDAQDSAQNSYHLDSKTRTPAWRGH
jgi:hypothetical protein